MENRYQLLDTGTSGWGASCFNLFGLGNSTEDRLEKGTNKTINSNAYAEIGEEKTRNKIDSIVADLQKKHFSLHFPFNTCLSSKTIQKYKVKLLDLGTEGFQQLCSMLVEETFSGQPLGLDNFLKIAPLKDILENIDPDLHKKYEAIIANMAGFKGPFDQQPTISIHSKIKNSGLKLVRIFDLFKCKTPWEAILRLQALRSLLAIIPFVVAVIIVQQVVEVKILPIWADADIIMAMVILSLIFFYLSFILYKGFRQSIPTQIKPLSNYTKDALETKSYPLLNRNDTIHKIFSCWNTTPCSANQYPLLVCQAGVETSAILLETARQISMGEFPQAVGKVFEKKITMFGGSALLFKTKDKIEKLLQDIGPYKNNIILALDDIHFLMNKRYGTHTGGLLKSMLGTGPKGLPLLIATTTLKEFQDCIASDPTWSLYFNVIQVNSLGDKEVVKDILREMLIFKFPQISVSESVLNHVWHETTEHLCKEPYKQVQPEISKLILKKAVYQISIQIQELFEEKQNDQIELNNFQSRYLLSIYSADSQEEEKNKKEIEKIIKMEKGVNKIDLTAKGLKEYQNISEFLAKCKEKLQKLAEKLLEDNNKFEVENGLFFYLHYIIPYCNAKIAEVRKNYKIPKLNKKFISKTIQEFKKLFDDSIAILAKPQFELNSSNSAPKANITTSSFCMTDQPVSLSAHGNLLKEKESTKQEVDADFKELPQGLSGVPENFEIEGAIYIPVKTAGHGACLLHAILGQEDRNGFYRWNKDDVTARATFAKDLNMKKSKGFYKKLAKILRETNAAGEFASNKIIWEKQEFYKKELSPVFVFREDLKRKVAKDKKQLVIVFINLCKNLLDKQENSFPNLKKIIFGKCKLKYPIDWFKTVENKIPKLTEYLQTLEGNTIKDHDVDSLKKINKLTGKIKKDNEQLDKKDLTFKQLATKKNALKAYQKVVQDSQYWFTGIGCSPH